MLGIRVVCPEFDTWVQGLSSIRVDDGAVKVWEAAMDVFDSKTQQYVHVVSGDLRGSSEVTVERAEHHIVGVLYFGITDEVDYAVYEQQRGGSHDFMERGIRATEAIFQKAALAASKGMIERVLGGI